MRLLRTIYVYVSEAKYIPRFSKNTRLHFHSCVKSLSEVKAMQRQWILFIRKIYHKMDELAFHSFMIIAYIFPLMSKNV